MLLLILSSTTTTLKNMKKSLTIVCMLISHITYADVPENQTEEVKHLLDFVSQSSCTINRNGTNHAGPKASKHIEKKYNYFKDEIKTTEDFIQYSATKSTITGSYYMVSCPNQKNIKTQQWLLNELLKLRKKHITNNPKESTTHCSDPRPQICTMEYVPVCASLKNNTTKTYASGCSACADKKVISYSPGDC